MLTHFWQFATDQFKMIIFINFWIELETPLTAEFTYKSYSVFELTSGATIDSTPVNEFMVTQEGAIDVI